MHLDDAHVEYAKALNTFQVVGTGTGATAHWMTAVEIVAVVAIALLGVRAARRHDGQALPALIASAPENQELSDAAVTFPA